MWASWLKGGLAGFILLMLFRDVSAEERLRGGGTEMRCAVDATQTLGAPKW